MKEEMKEEKREDERGERDERENGERDERKDDFFLKKEFLNPQTRQMN